MFYTIKTKIFFEDISAYLSTRTIISSSYISNCSGSQIRHKVLKYDFSLNGVSDQTIGNLMSGMRILSYCIKILLQKCKLDLTPLIQLH